MTFIVVLYFLTTKITYVSAIYQTGTPDWGAKSLFAIKTKCGLVGGKHRQFVTKNDKLRIPRKDSFGDFFFGCFYFIFCSCPQYIISRSLKYCTVNPVLCNIFEVPQKLDYSKIFIRSLDCSGGGGYMWGGIIYSSIFLLLNWLFWKLSLFSLLLRFWQTPR